MVVGSRRIQARIGEAVAHCTHAGGSGIGQPGNLNGRRPAREQQGPAAGHVHGQIDEDVDAILLNDGGQRLIVQGPHFAPMVGQPLDAPGEVIGALHAGIAEYFEGPVVVPREQGNREQRLTMIAEIRRDIADAQPARGRRVVCVAACREFRGEAVIPPQALFAHRAGLQGLKAQRVREVAVRRRVARIEFRGLAEAVDRLIELTQILEHAAEVVMQR